LPLPVAEALIASREATLDAGCIDGFEGWVRGAEALHDRDAAGQLHRRHAMLLLSLPPVWRQVGPRLEALARESEARIQAGQDLLVRMVEWDVVYGVDIASYRERVEETGRIADAHRSKVQAAETALQIRAVVENLPKEAMTSFDAAREDDAALPELQRIALEQIAAWEQSRYPEALRCKPNIRDPFLVAVYRTFWALQGDRKTIIVPMGGALPGAPSYSARALYFLANQIPPEDQALYERYLDAMEAKYRDLQPKGGKG
jgi:hypothetical protein